MTHTSIRELMTIVFTVAYGVATVAAMVHLLSSARRDVRLALTIAAAISLSWSVLGVSAIFATHFGLVTAPVVTTTLICAIALGGVVYGIAAIRAAWVVWKDRDRLP